VAEETGRRLSAIVERRWSALGEEPAVPYSRAEGERQKGVAGAERLFSRFLTNDSRDSSPGLTRPSRSALFFPASLPRGVRNARDDSLGRLSDSSES